MTMSECLGSTPKIQLGHGEGTLVYSLTRKTGGAEVLIFYTTVAWSRADLGFLYYTFKFALKGSVWFVLEKFQSFNYILFPPKFTRN